MKSFEAAIFESTCQKRITVCEIYDAEGKLLARESNRCIPAGGLCHRLSVSNTKSDYPEHSTCNWTHAEANAVKALPRDAKPYKAILYGHDFYCDNCEYVLKSAGVKVFEINPKILVVEN